MAYSACQADYFKHVKTYKDAIDLNVVLYNKVVKVKNEINVKYQQALIELTAKHQQNQEELQSHYTEMLTTTANSWGDYQNKHQGCLADLETSKNSQLTEINNYENTEKEKVNDQYNAELNAIEEAVKRKLQEIQELSDAHAAQRKRLHKSKFINACIAIAAGAATVFSGGLLSGVSTIVVQAVQTSLIATSLRALERLVNRKDKFGLDIQFSLSGPTPEKFTPSNRANRDTVSPTMEAPQFNLTTVRERFAAIQQNVKSWQATIEHNLFYSLHREILPVGNFSNALVNYGRQDTNNTRFSCNANLGALQANGYRSVAWNILSNNQTKWSGMDFMRDSDLCNIMRRFNVSNNAISSISNWHRPQVLSFDSNYVSSLKPMVEGPSQSTNQFTSEGQGNSSWSDNNLTISPKQQQQLRSNPSWMNSILSFPADLLFGQMVYADGLPQSNDSASSNSPTIHPEGIFNVFKSAVNGDSNAQLEMRRRVPIGATFADGINTSYRAWNDPILGFKNKVHNRLGASWFLPDSMDDLGEVCLNSVIAMAGVSAIPKIAEGYRKVQFAYQSYKAVQAASTASLSNRVTILAEGLSKSSAKELISSGKLNLPKAQLDKIMSTVNKASKSNSSITIKQVNTNGNVKVIVERPGYNGFQRFSSEIDTSGDRTIVVQTAYDKYGNIVQQRPGQAKNNILDVKLYKPKSTRTFQPKPE